MLKATSIFVICVIATSSAQQRPTRPSHPHVLPDQCSNCAPDQPCLINRQDPTCLAWIQANGHAPPSATASPAPEGCFRCGQTTADPCNNQCARSINPLTSTYCALNITHENVNVCCNRGSSGNPPSSCFGCFSRSNQPQVHCPSNTAPPAVARCGDLQVSDADTCDKFCANPNYHEGKVTDGKWTPGQRATCCCTDETGSSECCVDTDHQPLTTMSTASCLTSVCASIAPSILLGPGLSHAVTAQSHCDFSAPPDSPEFADCTAMEAYVKSALGNKFTTCCSCLKQLAFQFGMGQQVETVDCSVDDDDQL